MRISIHAPAKGATLMHIPEQEADLFQSTLPRRERQTRLDAFPELSRISIHAPAKGATKEAISLVRAYAFQSTLPRRERRGL